MPEDDPLAHYPGYLLRRASASALGVLGRRLGALGLRYVEASLLMVIGARPGLTQSEIGRMLEIQRANMVPIVARLEARGLLSRARTDGRSQGLHLSAAGEDLRQAALGEIERFETELTARLPEGLRGGAVDMLAALWAAAAGMD